MKVLSKGQVAQRLLHLMEQKNKTVTFFLKSGTQKWMKTDEWRITESFFSNKDDKFYYSESEIVEVR